MAIVCPKWNIMETEFSSEISSNWFFLQNRKKSPLFWWTDYLASWAFIWWQCCSHHIRACWYLGSTQGPSKLPGSHRKAAGKSEMWFCSSKPLAGQCSSSFLSHHRHSSSTCTGKPPQWVFLTVRVEFYSDYLPWEQLFPKRGIKQEYFLHYIVDAGFLGKMLPFLPWSSTSLVYHLSIYMVRNPVTVGKESNPLNHTTEKRIFLKGKF